jgi:hypothetical protein
MAPLALRDDYGTGYYGTNPTVPATTAPATTVLVADCSVVADCSAVGATDNYYRPRFVTPQLSH